MINIHNELNKSLFIGYISCIIAGISFGSIPVISSLMRDLGASSFEQAIIRLFFGAIVALVVIIIYSQSQHFQMKTSISVNLQKTYIIQGFLFSAMIVFYLSSISMNTPVGEAALLVQIHPFITLLIGWLFLKEKISIEHLVALLLAFLGLLLLTKPWEWTSFLQQFFGDLLAALNGFSYALYLVFGAYTHNIRNKVSPIINISWVLVWGFLTIIPMVLILSLLPLPLTMTSIMIENLFSLDILSLGILLALFGSIAPYGLIMLSNTFNIESSKQSILLLGEPISAMILGYFILSQEIFSEYIFGGIMLLTAIVLVTLSERKKESINHQT
ncbi:MAG: DMT family transporter [Candidatus Hodarchaeales archaeon]